MVWSRTDGFATLAKTHSTRSKEIHSQMNKIRSAEQLSDRLSEDLIWRKKELSQIQALVLRRDLPPDGQELCIRSGIVMLYAHWEGFIKSASNSYLEYVALQRLCYDQLATNFLALAMKAKLSEAVETNKPSRYIPVCDFFLSGLRQRCDLPYKNLPKDLPFSSANLNSQVLREMLSILGLDFSPYSTKAKLIDVKLLKKRNEIAHGLYLQSDRDDYLELHQAVLDMLGLFRNQVENAVANESFMRKTA